MKSPILLTIILLFAVLGAATTAWAIDTSSAQYTSNIQFLNLGLSRTNIALGQQLSGSALIDDGFMAADTLNAVIHEGPVQVAGMPPSSRIVVEGSIVDDGGSFSEFTVSARNATELDVALLPITPAVNDAHYFGCDNPCRIVSVDVGQEGIGDWTVNWEYFNGTAFTTASNVDDRTNAFQAAGLRTVSFDMPSDFATSTVTGSSVDAFWVRARVTSVSTSSQQAIGNQMFYENGQWWMWGESLSINEQILYNLSLGGPDLVTNHQIFPGTAGIVTPDDPTIELGDDFAVHWAGNVSFVTGSAVQCILCKGTTPGSPFRLFVSNNVTREITLEVTGSGSTSLSLSGIPEATAGATGSHTIDVVSDGTDLSLVIQGVGSATGTARTITDTADNYEWMSNGGAIFGDTMFIQDDSLSLALQSFDSEADWDTGVLVDTVSTAGQPDFALKFLSEADTDDGHWIEGTSTFTNGIVVVQIGYNGNGANTSSNGFFRFDNIAIAQGTTISTAIMDFFPFGTNSSTTVNLRISAIDADDAAAPTTFAGAEGATRTAAFVDWNSVPTFTADTPIDSIDFASVVQEIIDRPGWVSGSAIVMYFEDNGSSVAVNNFRQSSTAEDVDRSARLEITIPATTVSDDFVEMETTATVNSGFIDGWNTVCSGSGCVSRAATDQDERFGVYSMRLRSGTSVGTAGNVFTNPDLTASAGEVWSFRFGVSRAAVDDDFAFMRLRWRNSVGGTISTTDLTISQSASYQFLTLNAQTAPAGTATLEIQFSNECSTTCGSGDVGIKVDGVVACVCNPAPNFPDSANRVSNSSFERVFPVSGTWVSPTINPITTNVQSSLISFDVISPTGTTLLVETSTDGQASFQTATDGAAIPTISPGDDLTGSTLHIRATLTPATTDTQAFTPIIAFLFVTILGQVGPDQTVLFYQLRTTPNVTLEDLSPNSNDGTMSYPVQLSGIFSAITPLNSARIPLSQQAAIGVGDFTAPVTGSAALNLFGQDSGSFLPAGDVIVSAAANAGFPVVAIWVLLIMIGGIAAGAVVYNQTKPNQLPASIVLGATVVLATVLGDGIIPGWVPFVTIMLLVVWNLLRSRLPI